MSAANIFQKLRASAPASAVTALAGFLTLATPFTNATAQEPAVLKPSTPVATTLTAHHNSTSTPTSPHFTWGNSSFESAMPDAKINKRVAFWIMLPENGRYTPDKAGGILVAQMAQRGVTNVHSFGRSSPKGGDMEVIVYIGDKVYVSPLTGTTVFDLRSIIPQLDTIAEQYQEIQPSGRVAINKFGPESTP